MSRITPQIHKYYEGRLMGYEHYKTYHNHLKPDIKRLLNTYDCDEVFVVRERRGEWGEWTETWKLQNGKPAIVEQGWS